MLSNYWLRISIALLCCHPVWLFPVQSVTEPGAPVTTSPTSSPSGWPPSSRGTCLRGQSARPSRLATSGVGSPGAGSARGAARGTGVWEAGSWNQGLGSRVLVPGSWNQGLENRVLEPGSWKQGLGTRVLGPGSWNQLPLMQDQGQGSQDLGMWEPRDQGAVVKVPESQS